MAAVTTNGKGSGARSKARPKAEPDVPTSKDEEASSAPTPDAAAAAGEPGSESGSTPAHVCSVAFCPIGLAISAVQPLRPDAVEHLLVAGRELFLAMRTIVDARAEQFEGEDTKVTFEKIDIG
jgi:hypothetical protein